MKTAQNGVAKVELCSTGKEERQLPVVTWESPHPKAIELNLKNGYSMEEFKQTEFILTVHVDQELPLRRIVLRLRDNTGEYFQITPTATGFLKPGKNELHYNFDATNPSKSSESIWGGDRNKTVNWPLQLAGIAIDLNSKTPDHKGILLDSLTTSSKGELVSIALDTGNKLKLLLQGSMTSPELVVSNRGDQALELSGTLSIEDYSASVHTENVSTSIPAGGKSRIKIPGDFSRQGWWKVDCRLKNTTGNEYYEATHRFGRMNPAGPTPGRAEGEYLFGMCAHPQDPFSKSPATGELEALAAATCGVKIARTDLYWRQIQPQRDRWDFSLYDRIVDAYGRNGIEIQGILGYGVKWAVQEGYTPKDPSRLKREGSKFPDPHAYAEYAGEVTKHYKDKIRFFEIWNEPDIIGFANFPAESYMELLREAYDAIKQANPEAKVLSGGCAWAYTNRGNRPWANSGIIDLLAKDGGKHYDVFAIHAHGTFEKYISDLQLLQDYNMIGSKAPRPWYSNESGLSSAQFGERKQASTLFERMLYAWSEGAMAYNWYVIREKSHYPIGHHERHFGLITPDFEPKPGYIVYNMLANIYGGGKFLRRLDFTPGIYACLFENRAQDGLLALWGNGTSKLLGITGLPAGTTRIDLFGNEKPFPVHNGLAILQVSEEPFSLRIPNIEKHNIQCMGELFSGNLPKQLSVLPGKSREFSVTVNNPLREAIDLNFNAQTSGKVSVKLASDKLNIPANGSKVVLIKLTADQEFKTTPFSPEKLVLSVAPTWGETENMEILVFSRTSGDEPMFQLDKPEQYYTFVPSVPGNEPWYWKGSQDLSAKVYMKHSSSILQLKVEVCDDVHVQPFRGTEVWNGDNVQFALQIPGQKGFWKFGLTRLADGKSEVFCWNHPTDFTDSIDGITLNTTRDDATKITSYTPNIPLKLLGMTPDTVTSGFRFNLIVNDNDDDRREGFIYVAPGLGINEDPMLWPMLFLQ